ncbi:hypothetical protein EVJ58_g7416 [Rhodofomes roseus]|uniref:Uncharacterized protein n=1 Tax=Rhodofomes roseus TaxID=34475 RepID=A0A4Y9Y347_9APHY|nr:hypothetical protein EVJ58_g7416 [Rhodofomes roseus]
MAQPSELSDICMAFLGPSVTSLTVASGPTDSASSLTALTQAPLLAPSLEQLDIDFRWSPDPSRLLVGALKTLRKLRVLRLTLPTEPLGEIWAAVADLPSLTSLYVGRDELGAEVDSSPSGPAVEGLNSRIQFAQLIDLSLLNFRMSDNIDLLDRLDLPNLTDLTLSPFRDDLYPCERLFDTIAKRCPPSLSKLRIEPPSRQAHAPRVEASARSFRALQAFHDLRVLRLSSVRDLTDELLFEIADAWPALEELTLLPARSSSPEMSATLLGLTYVAETCRNLHTLALNFRPFFGTSPQSSWPHGAPPRGTRPNARVKTLDVHTAWPIYGDGVQAVAAVLAESFASLETIRELGVEAEETWREVQDLLPALRAERSEVRCGLDTLERRG